MITTEDLIQKGFEFKKYTGQEGQPVFYQYETNNQIEVEKLTCLLGTDFELFDHIIYVCTIEIMEDHSLAQYLIRDIADSTNCSHGELGLNEFQSILNML